MQLTLTMQLSKFMILFIFVLQCVITTISQQNLEYHFSHIALQMPESLDRRKIRQNWLIVPHLYKGDKLKLNICIEESTVVQIKDIKYSNDGNMKTILITHNGVEVGRFDTHAQSDWGNLWDKPYNSGEIGQTQVLSPGKHELILEVKDSLDCYGFEPWSIYVNIFVPENPRNFWCGSTYSLAEQPTTCIPDIGDSVSAKVHRVMTPPTTPFPPTYVHVNQHSYHSKCLDDKNVKISFTTRSIEGTVIHLQQEPRHRLQQQQQHFRERKLGNVSRLCHSEIWQFGKADDNNGEFKAIYSGKVLKINLTGQQPPEDIFPAKLLPFVTTDIYIHFEISPDVDIYHGSSYFTLGLVNLTMPADVGLRYYDYTLQNFSAMHVLPFTPQYQVMGWNIPNLGKTRERNNTIHLHFQSEANIIRFDFLRLEYRKRDERKLNTVLARRGSWKVRGLRYETSAGLKVSVDNMTLAANMEEAVLLYQFGPFSRYETVFRLKADGMFYLYKSFRPQAQSQNAMILVDVSGFYFLHDVKARNLLGPKPIRFMSLDTLTDAVRVHYEDGSVLNAQLTATPSETKMQITRFETATDQKKTNNQNLQVNNAQGVVFTSTYINDDLAAVNVLSTEGKEKQIMENMDDLSGYNSYLFRKTSQTNVFYANDLTVLQFPTKV